MSHPIITVEIRCEQDIVLARQRARAIADLLGFDTNEQARVSTAVSEIARNAFVYAAGGKVEFLVEDRDRPQLFIARVKDRGPGLADVSAVLEGRSRSTTGSGMSLVGARRLMDSFHIESAAGKGTTVLLGKKIPGSAPVVTAESLALIVEHLSRQTPKSAFEEVQQQNQELLRAMQELEQHQDALEVLNRELEDTNRGIVALHAELDDNASSLSLANDLKVRFLSNMSRDFRTPLNSIRSLSRLLLDRVDGELTGEQEKQVVFIRKAAEGLSALVDDLLDIAKIEAGKTEVHPAEFGVDTVFSALRGMLKPVFVNPAVNLVFEEPPPLPVMRTDGAKVSQILRDLISNAIKFTEKGQIRVSASLGDDGRRVVFSVSDTGIGIAAEQLDHLFEEYAQVDSPVQQRVKGTGLGLSVSKKLTELLGGRLVVESVPGQGSTFSAIIPLVFADAAATSQLASTPPDRIRRPVLIIDDDEMDRYLFKSYMAGSGYVVVEAAGGSEGLACAEREQPSIIFLDLMMPGMDGFETLARLKASPATAHIPVVMLSCKVLDDAGRRTLSARAMGILSKASVSREDVVAAVRDAVARSAGRR